MLSISDRKELYAFLARLFAYPDEELLIALHDPRTVELIKRLHGAPAQPPAVLDASLAELEVAYTSLFINRFGGVPAPPYGSVYLDGEGQLMGASTRKAAEWYVREGLALDGNGEPPDHLPTELEFLYYLIGQEGEALRRRDVTAAREWSDKAAAFGGEHLFVWAPQFATRLAKADGVAEAYLWGAHLLEHFCRHEYEWLGKLKNLHG
jgi:TorA maturation chaperone TorD